jgi:uncharacterized RDD family membrane protein YckC
MKNILPFLAGVLLAGLSVCVAPAQTAPGGAPLPPPVRAPQAQAATHPTSTVDVDSSGGSRQVQIGTSGIDVRSDDGYVEIGDSGIRITSGPESIFVHDRDYDCPSDQELVAIGHDATLDAGKTACDVVSLLGNATVNGEVTDSAVAVLGDLTLNGRVGNSAVSVFGSNSINGPVDGNAVSVFGDMMLGPKANVEGQVVNLFGSLERAPAAVVHGGTINVMTGLFRGAHGLQAWAEHCLIFGRLLAPRLDIGWAWGFAVAILLFYLFLAALFREGLQRCVQTLDDHPGPSILAALAMVLVTPILAVALLLTVIGVLVIPLFWLALLCAGIFGRVVALGWLGGRIVRGAHSELAQPVLRVLIGGLLALVLYMVPVLGFIVYAAIGLIGFGAVVYTVFVTVRPGRGAPLRAGESIRPEPSAAPGPETPADGPATAATAAPIDWTTLPRAGFWIRIAALLIDLVLVGFVLSLIDHRGPAGTLLVLAGYGAVMWKLRGTTVGGIICNLRVVRIDGRSVGWETAVLRALGCFLSLVAAGLGFFWIAFDRERQGWHDKIAGTVVVLVPKAGGLV